MKGMKSRQHWRLQLIIATSAAAWPVGAAALQSLTERAAGARTKALWEIFPDAGRPVLVSGWWATWPPDRVRGVIVSDRVAVPHMRLDTNEGGLVHPAERLRDVAAARVAPDTIDYATLNQFVPL